MKPSESVLSSKPGLTDGRFWFKYRQLDARLIKIIRDRELHFAPASSFNDPFDCDLESLVEGSTQQLGELWEECVEPFLAVQAAERLEYIRHIDGQSDLRAERNDHNFWRKRHDDNSGRDELLRVVDEYSDLLETDSENTNPGRYKVVLKEFYASLVRFGKKRFGICSMAGDPLSILMWSHYAENHTGVLLAFDGVTRIFEKQPGISHHPVKYSLERKVNVAREGWPGSFVQLYTRKAAEWSYEKESRYVSHNGPGPKKYKRHMLKAIVLGCRFSESFQTEPKRGLALELFSLLEKEDTERVSGAKIQIYLAQKVRGEFKLCLKKLHNAASLYQHFGISPLMKNKS